MAKKSRGKKKQKRKSRKGASKKKQADINVSGYTPRSGESETKEDQLFSKPNNGDSSLTPEQAQIIEKLNPKTSDDFHRRENKIYRKIIREIGYPSVQVRFCDEPGKGKGLFAREPIKKEVVIFEESPFVFWQVNRGFAWACGSCLRFLGPLELQARHRFNKVLGDKFALPYKQCAPHLAHAQVCRGGCGMETYCSELCSQSAWDQHHKILCPGPKAGNSKKLTEFYDHRNVTANVDAILAAKIIAIFVQRCQRGGDIDEAFAHATLPFSERWSEVVIHQTGSAIIDSKPEPSPPETTTQTSSDPTSVPDPSTSSPTPSDVDPTTPTPSKDGDVDPTVNNSTESTSQLSNSGENSTQNNSIQSEEIITNNIPPECPMYKKSSVKSENESKESSQKGDEEGSEEKSNPSESEKNAMDEMTEEQQKKTFADALREPFNLFFAALPDGKWKKKISFELFDYLCGLCRLNCTISQVESPWMQYFHNVSKISQSAQDESLRALEPMTNVFRETGYSFQDAAKAVGKSLFMIHSTMNHSCDPTARVGISKIHGTGVGVIATKYIPKGSEVTVSYINPIEDVVIRRKLLKAQYMFDCKCKKCVRQLKELDELNTTSATHEES